MRLRESDVKSIKSNPILGFKCDDTGKVDPEYFLRAVYPPIGFLPWSALEVGNGDVYGFYWPLGKEEAQPLVCTTYHDSYYLSPISSNIENLIKSLWLEYGFGQDEEDDESTMCDELLRLAEVFNVNIEELNEVKIESPIDLLKIDNDSPGNLLKASQEYTERNELLKAEDCLTKAMHILPEFTGVAFELSKLYRRQREDKKALEQMILTCISPICFGGTKPRQQCLQWIKLLNGEKRSLVDDPFMNFVDKFTFKVGEKHNDDFVLYEQLIERYIQIGEFRKALSLRVLTAELITSETKAFQERYCWSNDLFFDKLKNQLKLSGYFGLLEVLSNE